MIKHLRSCAPFSLVPKIKDRAHGSQCAPFKKWKKNHLKKMTRTFCLFVPVQACTS
jgi:hypothetical protein